MDAFRAIAWEESGATETEDGEEGVGMQVLGGWVYKNQLERSMTPREWSHLYDLVSPLFLSPLLTGLQSLTHRISNADL